MFYYGDYFTITFSSTYAPLSRFWAPVVDHSQQINHPQRTHSLVPYYTLCSGPSHDARFMTASQRYFYAGSFPSQRDFLPASY